jgi:hypothetical protein
MTVIIAFWLSGFDRRAAVGSCSKRRLRVSAESASCPLSPTAGGAAEPSC